jgi:hypothetical protein
LAVSVWSVAGALVFLGGMYLFMLWMIWRREFVLARFPRWLARLPRVKEGAARQALSNLIDGLAGISSARYLIVLMIWSCITWGLFWAFHFGVLVAIGVDIDQQTMLAISLGSLALVPPSATTLPGIYQASMVVPLVLLGYNENLLTSYALILNAVEMSLILLLGIWGASYGGHSIGWLLAKRAASEGD